MLGVLVDKNVDKKGVIMKNYIRFIPIDDIINEQTTQYVYKIGETITVNSTQLYKCISITEENGNKYFNFNTKER